MVILFSVSGGHFYTLGKDHTSHLISACLPWRPCCTLEFYLRRFWYENPGVFTPAQLTELRHASLGRVICDSSDNIQEIQRDVFQLVSYPSGYLRCDSDHIPHIDFKVWAHCCQGNCCQSYYCNTYHSWDHSCHLQRITFVRVTVTYCNSVKLNLAWMGAI